jgi:quercetin dioxygenase-like cupin family protein
MRPGQSGPAHSADREQVWVVLEGRLTVNDREHEAGETIVIPAGEQRRISAPAAVKALVASHGGATVTTADGTRPLPWAA